MGLVWLRPEELPWLLLACACRRSGSGILDTQAETDARVTLSRTRDNYPGTTSERVCMYTGTLRSVLAALLCTLHKQHIARDESAWQQGSASARTSVLLL